MPEEQEHNHTGQRQRRNTGKGQNQNSGEGAGSDTGQPRFPQIQIAGNRRAALQQNRQQYRVVRIEQGREGGNVTAQDLPIPRRQGGGSPVTQSAVTACHGALGYARKQNRRSQIAGRRVAVHPMAKAAVTGPVATDAPFEIDGNFFTAQEEHAIPAMIGRVVEALK